MRCVVNEDRIIRETRSTRAKSIRSEERARNRVFNGLTLVRPVNAACNLPDIRAIRVEMDGFARIHPVVRRVFHLLPNRAGRAAAGNESL